MYLAGSAEGSAGDFAEAEVSDFAFSGSMLAQSSEVERLGLLLEFCHRFNSLFNGRLPIHAMAVIQINTTYAQSFQALRTRSFSVFRVTIVRHLHRLWIEREAELGSKKNLEILSPDLDYQRNILTSSRSPVRLNHFPKRSSLSP